MKKIFFKDILDGSLRAMILYGSNILLFYDEIIKRLPVLLGIWLFGILISCVSMCGIFRQDMKGFIINSLISDFSFVGTLVLLVNIKAGETVDIGDLGSGEGILALFYLKCFIFIMLILRIILVVVSLMKKSNSKNRI